jgi:murein DD-endopeptidase MepM/ murein hydrolase activator NlpD
MARLALVFLLTVTCLAVPALAQEPTAEPDVYVVQAGDTLTTIAQRYGTTVEALAAANHIENPALIAIGQKLIIPAVTATPAEPPQPERPARQRVHPVRPGETLPFLAFRYGTTPWALLIRNGLELPGLLQPGQDLIVPPPITSTLDVPGFPVVQAHPDPVAEGQTLVLTLEPQGGELEVAGRLLDQPLTFITGTQEYWALLGVDALTRPGAYTLVLTATETASGDRITMQETVAVTRSQFSTINVAVPASRQGLLDPDVSVPEQKRVAEIMAGVTPRKQWTSPFQFPLQGELHVNAPFGQRRSYSGGPVSSYHAGLDLGADEGTPVHAPAQGTVVLAEPLQVRGNAVILDHGWGVFSGYWHLSRIDVVPGQVVMPGDPIGLVGSTGLSTGAHLHWEMRVWGVAVNPVQWTDVRIP